MINFENLSINARIAVCLICAEKMIPTIENMIKNNPLNAHYLDGKQQIVDILDLAWGYLPDPNQIDWSEMYELCNEGYGWTEDTRYNVYGYFDFVLIMNSMGDEDFITISNMMIFCFLYTMYHFSKRQKEIYLSQDLEWFEIPGSEEEALAQINKAVQEFLPPCELQTVEGLLEELHKLYPFNPVEPYGEYIEKEQINKLLGV